MEPEEKETARAQPPLPRSLAVNGRMRGAITAAGAVPCLEDYAEEGVSACTQTESGRKRKIFGVPPPEASIESEGKRKRAEEEKWNIQTPSSLLSNVSSTIPSNISTASPSIMPSNSSPNVPPSIASSALLATTPPRVKDLVKLSSMELGGSPEERSKCPFNDNGTEFSRRNSVEEGQRGGLKRMRDSLRSTGGCTEEWSDGCEIDDDQRDGKGGRGKRGGDLSGGDDSLWERNASKHQRKMDGGSFEEGAEAGEVVDAERRSTEAREGERMRGDEEGDGSEMHGGGEMGERECCSSSEEEGKRECEGGNTGMPAESERKRTRGSPNEVTSGFKGKEGEVAARTAVGEREESSVGGQWSAKGQLRRVDSDGGLGIWRRIAEKEGEERKGIQKTLRRAESDGTGKGIFEQYRRRGEEEDDDEEDEAEGSFVQQMRVGRCQSVLQSGQCDVSNGDFNDDQEEYSTDIPKSDDNLKFVLSSGRESKQSDSLCSRKPTIDDEFDHYFSQLLL